MTQLGYEYVLNNCLTVLMQYPQCIRNILANNTNALSSMSNSCGRVLTVSKRQCTEKEGVPGWSPNGNSLSYCN